MSPGKPERQRRPRGTAMKRLCVDLSLSAYQALLELAGEDSYGLTLDRLIERARASKRDYMKDRAITN